MKKNGKIILILLICFAGIAALISSRIAARADEEESEEVQTTVHINGDKIEVSTLIVGTHLIYLGALNEQLYTLAKNSVSDVNQFDYYYKSELGGGNWYNISNASSLFDISESGISVDVSVINELEVRYHTKSDGITYDLITGEAVGIFDIVNPYKIEENSDLDELTMQKALLENKEEKTDSDTKCLELLNEFYESELSTESTTECDKLLEKMQKQYQRLAGQDGELAQVLLDNMEKIDNTRRAETSKVIAEKLTELLDAVQYEEDKSALSEAIGNSINNVSKTAVACGINQYEKSGEEADIGEKLLQELVEAAERGGDITKQLGEIQAYNSIINGISKNVAAEKVLLTEKIVPEIISELSDVLTTGAAAESEELESKLADLEYFTKAATNKMDAGEATSYLLSMKEKMESLKKLAEKTENRDVLTHSLNSYENQLDSMYKNHSQNAMHLLKYCMENKEILEQRLLTALDNNDYETVEQCEKELEFVLLDIQKEEERLSRIIASPLTTEEEKLDAEVMLAVGNVSAALLEKKEQILDAIGEKDFSFVGEQIEGISALASYSPALAETVLKELYAALAEAELLDNSLSQEEVAQLRNGIDKITNAMVENYEVFEKGVASADDISNLITREYGDQFSLLPPEKQVEIVMALYSYEEEHLSDEITALVDSMVALMYNKNNPYIYLKLRDKKEYYMPLEVICRLSSGCRYVYDQNQQEAIIRNSTNYYRFELFSKVVKRPNGKSDEMSEISLLQDDMYIPCDYVYKEFGLSCLYIDNLRYAIAFTQEQVDRSVEFLNLLIYEDY